MVKNTEVSLPKASATPFNCLSSLSKLRLNVGIYSKFTVSVNTDHEIGSCFLL